jgi:hypothetical protein
MQRLCILAVFLGLNGWAAEQPTPTLDVALHQLYSFDFTSAQATIDQLVAAAPQDPVPYSFRAAGYVFYELHRMGILEGEFFSNDDWAYDHSKKTPDPQVRARLLQALNDTGARGQVALKSDPNDKNALFALCVAQGVTADYMALIEKKQFGSLSPTKRGNSYAQQLLRLDPKYYDAYVTAGFSEYVVGSLPFFVRWFVHWDGINGSKELGKQHLETAAREGHYLKPFAKILLAIAAVREKRVPDAQKIMADLTRDYPTNPLFRKELAKLNGRLGISAN